MYVLVESFLECCVLTVWKRERGLAFDFGNLTKPACRTSLMIKQCYEGQEVQPVRLILPPCRLPSLTRVAK